MDINPLQVYLAFKLSVESRDQLYADGDEGGSKILIKAKVRRAPRCRKK
jgi:hypothetical protein